MVRVYIVGDGGWVSGVGGWVYIVGDCGWVSGVGGWVYIVGVGVGFIL